MLNNDREMCGQLTKSRNKNIKSVLHIYYTLKKSWLMFTLGTSCKPLQKRRNIIPEFLTMLRTKNQEMKSCGDALLLLLLLFFRNRTIFSLLREEANVIRQHKIAWPMTLQYTTTGLPLRDFRLRPAPWARCKHGCRWSVNFLKIIKKKKKRISAAFHHLILSPYTVRNDIPSLLEGFARSA